MTIVTVVVKKNDMIRANEKKQRPCIEFYNNDVLVHTHYFTPQEFWDNFPCRPAIRQFLADKIETCVTHDGYTLFSPDLL